MIKIAKNWSRMNIIFLKYICGVKYKVLGNENIPKGKNFLVVSKHQSAWETYFLFQYFDDYLVSVVKKELLYVIGMSTALKVIGCIPIDRKDGMHALKKMVQQSKKFATEDKRSILIFPQGTRVPVNSSVKDYPYMSGFVGIGKENQLDLLPIALNSGICWPKGSFTKRPGTITVKIIPTIKYDDYKDLNRNEIVKLVENAIEENQKLL
jgi:1-acyl-sn-glycerol-3-phosphate acyltransferase